MRCDVYPDSIRSKLRAVLKNYVEVRSAYYHAPVYETEFYSSYHRSRQLGQQVWDIAAAHARIDLQTAESAELLPALNTMIDLSMSRLAMTEATIPDSILYFLFALCFCASFLLGYDGKSHLDWIVVVGFSIMLSATVYNILDLDRSRTGLINIDVAASKIDDLLKMF
jgi:hypothetical protein